VGGGASLKFYKRFPGDIQIKTGGLTLAEFGAYDRLLDHYYATEEPIATDEVYSITRALTRADRDAVDKVLRKFFDLGADGYTQERADEMIAEALPKIEAARENGKHGGRPKGSKKKPTGLFSETKGVTETADSEKASQSQSSSLRSEDPPASRVPPWEPPAWMPLPQWQAFVSMRKAKGKRAPFTDAARDGIVASLAKFSGDGHDPAVILQESVNNGWSGVFAPRTQQAGAMSFRERDAAAAAARVHEMTGGLVSAKPVQLRRADQLQEVFDATPRLVG